MSSKRKCIIYGGGGFIGSHLADTLVKDNFEVTIFDKLYFNKSNITHLKNKVKVIEGDFNNAVDLKESLKNQDFVYHLVSSTIPANSNQNPVYDVETNIVSSLKLFAGCVKEKIKKIIFISSGGTVYGIPREIPIKEGHPRKPICSYGITKKTIEDYLYMYNKIFNLDYTVFRLSNPYGERQNPFVSQGVIPVFLKKIILNEKIVVWGDGSVIRDFIYIKDTVDILVKSINKDTKIKVFNLSSGKGVSLAGLLKQMKAITGKNPVVEYQSSRSVDVPVNILSNALVRKTFKWKPGTDFKTGLERTYKYLLKSLKN
jgi:UDP-glucose 4-epimerase